MREIKFRGWYTNTLGNIMLSPEFHGPINEIFNDPDNKGRVVYMQYTGLKDKNGVEIFEGDVIQCKFVHPPFGKFTGEVIFNEGQWWVDNDRGAIPLWDESAELVVLGSVFENPELLEESE